MMEITVKHIMAMLSLGGGIIMVLALLSLRISLTQRIKKYFHSSNEYWESGALDFGMINTIVFCWVCVLPNLQNGDQFKSMYPGFDVKKFANRFEVLLAFLVVFGLLSMFFFGAVFQIFDGEGVVFRVPN